MFNHYLSLFCFLTGANFLFAQEHQFMLYGDREEIIGESLHTYRVFYDKNGDLYPDGPISNEVLAAEGGTLLNYFKKHTSHFKELSKTLHLDFEGFSDSNYRRFQEVLLDQTIQSINQKSQPYQSIVCLIHGFRKPLGRKRGDSSSLGDNQVLRTEFERNTKEKRPFFIEIYWDGTYVPRSRKLKELRQMMKLFENQAIQNANITGYQLRKLVSKIQKPKISVIAHSLGARVLTTCLFNAEESKVPASFLQYPTPNQDQFNICLFAPAIPASLYNHFEKRNAPNLNSEKDNYNLFLLYNEKDVVLRKKWKGLGPGPRKHGRTTLGCNHRKEAIKLQKKFAEQHSNTIFEISDATDYGICHAIGCYAYYENFQQMITFIDTNNSQPTTNKPTTTDN